MDLGLENSAILVTGASGGIGQATARLLAAEGARVGLHYRSNTSAVETLAGELGGDAVPLHADLRDEQQVDALFDQALHAFGRLDGVVANAGIWVEDDVPLHQMTLEQWRHTMETDLTSAFFTCRAFLRHLAAVPRRSASLVLVGSTAALVGEAGHADYSAAKAAMSHGLTLTLKNEIVRLAPRGRVNCVCPGWVDTPMSASAASDPAAVARATSTMALRKIATAEDVAQAIVFFLSEKLSGHLSGTLLPVAGGMEGRLLHDPKP
jgi:3-oxoacyl-[acyl-carrier protein] reductase